MARSPIAPVAALVGLCGVLGCSPSPVEPAPRWPAPPRASEPAHAALSLSRLSSIDGRARARLAQAVAERPARPDELAFQAALAEGGDAFVRGDDEAALRAFERALDLRPSDPSARCGRAVALLELDRLDEAEAALDELDEQVETLANPDWPYLLQDKRAELEIRRDLARRRELPCTVELRRRRFALERFPDAMALWRELSSGPIAEFVAERPTNAVEARRALCPGSCPEGVAKLAFVGDDESVTDVHLIVAADDEVDGPLLLLRDLGMILGGRCTPHDTIVEIEQEGPRVHLALLELESEIDFDPYPTWRPGLGSRSACRSVEGERRDLWIDLDRGRVIAEARRVDPDQPDPAETLELSAGLGDGEERVEIEGCGETRSLELRWSG